MAKDAYADSLSELSEFVIHDLQATGKELGRGAYGTVEELDMNGTKCAGKRIYSNRTPTGFILECKIVSILRHPHIVQFLGVFYPVGSRLPTLVMEKMQYNLHHVLEKTVNVGFAAKIAILHDASKGLLYLHKYNILHHNLTAHAILLNSAMIVKISGFTVSRIIPRGTSALTLTQVPGEVPGAPIYMPPEAFGVYLNYGLKIDYSLLELLVSSLPLKSIQMYYHPHF